VFYILGLASTIAYAMNQVVNGRVLTANLLNSGAVRGLRIIAVILFLLASIYVVYNLIRICMREQLSNHRHQVFMMISSVFFVCSFIFFLVGGYNVFTYSTPQVFLSLTIMNLYTVFMLYLYSPTSKQIE
jgi:hypothetical protein